MAIRVILDITVSDGNDAEYQNAVIIKNLLLKLVAEHASIIKSVEVGMEDVELA